MINRTRFAKGEHVLLLRMCFFFVRQVANGVAEKTSFFVRQIVLMTIIFSLLILVRQVASA